MKVRAILFFIVGSAFMALAIYWRSQFVPVEPSDIVKAVEVNITRDLSELRAEARGIVNSINKSEEWPTVRHAFFLYDTSGIVKWTTNRFYPELVKLAHDSIVYHRVGEGHYLFTQFHLPDNKFLVAFLLLQEGFPIENQYIGTRINNRIFPDGVSFNSSALSHPIQIGERDIFSIAVNPSLATQRKYETFSWFAFVVGFVSLAFATWMVTKHLVRAKHNWIAALVVFTIIFGIRLVMVYGNFPGQNSTLPIFDPKLFASSSFNDSIGNLFINSIAFLAVALCFFYFLKNEKSGFSKQIAESAKILIGAIFLSLSFVAQLLPFLYLETLYHNSNFNVDISQQLYFNAAQWLAFGCVMISAATGCFFLLTFFRIARWVVKSNCRMFLGGLGLAGAVLFIYHLATDRNYEIPILLTVINLVVLYGSTGPLKLKFIPHRYMSLTLWLLVIFSLQGALAIRMLGMEKQREGMIKFGNTFLIERDNLGEYLLDQAISKIEADDFIQQQILYPFNRQHVIAQKIKSYHLNSYFDKYETRIYLFDNRGESVGGSSTDNLPALIRGFIPVADHTNYRGIYFINSPSDQYLKRYIAVIPIKYHVTGYIVLDLTLRQFQPVTVFPKLLLDRRFSDYERSGLYSFAVFNQEGDIANSSGNYRYSTSAIRNDLTNPILYQKGIVRDDFLHIGIDGLSGQVIIVSAPAYSVFNAMANFSLYVLLGIAFVLMVYLILNGRILTGETLTYSDRIQLYVYLAIVLPLIVISVTTLRMNSRAETQRLESESASRANLLASGMATVLAGSTENLQQQISSHTKATGVDATLFSKDGILLASSQPGIFSNQLVSKYIRPFALAEVSKGNFLFTMDDEVGDLKFRNTFAAVRAPSSGETLAILSLPFFEWQESTEQAQLRLVSNILIVFVFVLLGFYLLSFVALNWLTAPLRVIAASLKRTSLSGNNRKLQWNSKDEIGGMVHEYNMMIDNLEVSKIELEKRQREATWREMAKQVAHEIKNPLTPIKLTLQQMERALQEGKAEPQKSIESVKSVLHQVEILNGIASSFSAFAQMPEVKLEKLNIVEVLKDVVVLFNEPNGRKVNLEIGDVPAMVLADRKLFLRVFSNIILNAFQAEQEHEKIQVTIGMGLSNGNWVISFGDNGKGMPTEIVDKIFIPYFSTKETGSGLGLAIAKQGIEQAGGKIWCESVEGRGTVFNVSLPAVG